MTPPERPWPGSSPWEPPARRPDLIPGVGIPASPRREAFDGLFARRVLFLRGPLDDTEAADLSAELMTLDGVSAEPVTLMVNSAGGPLSAVFAVIDTMRLMRAPVTTVCVGQALGTAAAVVVLGTGGRQAAANATLSLRVDTHGELRGDAWRVRQQADHLASLLDRLAGMLAEASALPLEVVRDDLEHGRPMAVEEAVASRLVDSLRTGERP
jgi:ATP-dependent Clp protease, protease subunit